MVFRLFALILFFSFSFLSFSGCGCRKKSPHSVHLQGQTMGTFYRVSIVSPHLKDGGRSLKKEIDAFFLRFNETFSHYIDSSEVSKINRQAAKKNIHQKVSPELFAELQKSLKISREVGGAFDVTLAPLIHLWGFGKKHHEKIPSQSEINRAKKLTGYRQIALSKEKWLSMPRGFLLDFSAISKGTAVDELAAFLEKRGFTRYLIDIGGEMVMRGKNDRDLPWRIKVAFPPKVVKMTKKNSEILISHSEFRQPLAIATSGNYFNYFEKNGQRYTHIIDPSTGFPTQHKVVSVTVLADFCFRADALATALMVLGENDGFALAKKNDWAVYFIYEGPDGRLLTKMTKRFARFLVK